ncbi:MAG TPA: DNA-directed RNA polymerase subunit alpha [Candidatus Hydrogenedentes bacterium]|nr:DNA-directed RNA polymerase subunit alpha [Candidatus Hydrogenedentota bacterium]HRK35379.1 DNA-directed RNA polymerase subunit alpha [Candidatus Hydrogenedentota bacterium]
MIHKEFVLPKSVKISEGSSETYARFIVEPFERGYGTTMGNALRRVLLASLEGAAVTAIKIEGIHHEFSAIPGVKEDVTDVVLNFKRAQLRLNSDQADIITFKHKGAGPVTAGMIFANTKIDVLNPDHLIYTATSASHTVEMKVKVARGRGYMTAEHFELEHAEIGTIYLDASFSPVTRVNFQVEDARVGQHTDYDRLILDVWTNGSIQPEKAVEEAANLFIDHLKILVDQRREETESEAVAGADDPELARTLARSVNELELSVRAANCLKAASISTIGELVSRTEAEMLQFHNFGKKSLDEIKALLEAMGLSLGMNVGLTLPPPSAINAARMAAAGEEDDDDDEDADDGDDDSDDEDED